MLKERETLLIRPFFLKVWYTSKVSDALVRRGTLYIHTKFNVLGINFIVGRFLCMIYVMKSMVYMWSFWIILVIPWLIRLPLFIFCHSY